MTMVPKMMPFRVVCFEGPHRGKIVATVWVRFGEDVEACMEATAGRMADEWACEMDVEAGAVFPSGKVASWDRVGMRVRPTEAVS
jgi:hypothetical protein